MRTLLLTLAVCLFVLPASAKYSGGTGEPNDPYQIATAADLIALGETPADYDKHFILTADIDLDPNLPGRRVFDKAVIAPDTDSNDMWTNEFQGTPFTGVLDGDSYAVSRLTIKGGGYLGLFGRLTDDAQVRGLCLVAADVTGFGAHFGDHVGGLIGYVESGRVSNCSVTGMIVGSWYVGGLVGKNCGMVTACHNGCDVTGDHAAGGVVGSNYLGSITVSDNVGAVNGDWYSWYIGGVTGENQGVVTMCQSSGPVTGERYVGGLVGYGDGSVTNSFNTGPVTGDENVGGLVGQGGMITNCYSAGRVRGKTAVGGLVGEYGGPAVNCFWDTDTSGYTWSPVGKGLTTALMKDPNTYLDAGWDFVGEARNGLSDVWQMAQESGYPLLTASTKCGWPPLVGRGTAQEPYLISTARELGAVYRDPDACYKLVQSLDLSGVNLSTAVIEVFSGAFDGNHLSVRNLTIRGGGHVGLFGRVERDALVRNVRVEDFDVSGGRYVGGLAGDNMGLVTTCFSSGRANGSEANLTCVGGLVGSNFHGEVVFSSSKSTVCGNDCVGVLVGRNYRGSVIDCDANGTVTGRQCVGGLIGDNEEGSVTECHGFCYVVGGRTSVDDGRYVGGLVGSNGNGRLANCSSTGSVTGNKYVGGLAGGSTGTVEGCSSNVGVQGAECVGGLLGHNGHGRVTNCHANGGVTGRDSVGGLIGSSVAENWSSLAGDVVSSYSTGAVNGGRNTGGLMGKNERSTLVGCVWDVNESHQATSAGGTGKTTTEMQTASTFLDTGWDFVGETLNGKEDIWWIFEGKDYPRLWWEQGDEASK
jgi:hypothetical protein